MWQAEVSVACHYIGTMTVDGLFPLELEGLTDDEGRNDIGNGVGYGHPNNNPCTYSNVAFSEDPKVQ
jgi:hypothetical protein